MTKACTPPGSLAAKQNTPRRGIRLADYVAILKIESGDWRIDTENGEIYNRITGTPLTFSQCRDKYERLYLRYNGFTVTLFKHRIIYLAGHCDLSHLPSDLNLEVDHINHDIHDCRLENLRLIPGEENRIQSSRKFTAEEVIQIRKRCEAGEYRRKIARELGVAESTIRRIADRTYYKEIP
ncbi:MAG: HNH endonuclease [Oscillospiraceae bacterium]|nr:HNH endonuclease [Oscillospiraceae bacterium]